MQKVYVYEKGYNETGEGSVVGRVNYNSRLDFWDGNNWTSGYTGRHLGITKLRNGCFVLIYGTQWQGEKDIAVIVSDHEAYQAIAKSGNLEILEEKKFSELKRFEQSLIEEAY